MNLSPSLIRYYQAAISYYSSIFANPVFWLLSDEVQYILSSYFP